MIHVWLVELDRFADSGAEQCLSIDEHERAEKYLMPLLHDRFIAGRAALRHVLAACLNRKASEIVFSYGTKGKPECEGIYFNASNSGGFGAIAVSFEGRVGIDIEDMSLGRCNLAIADYFSEEEKALIAAMPEKRREESFYALWVRKEAVMKAVGTGLSLGLDKVVTQPREEGDRTRIIGSETAEYWRTPLFLYKRIIAAVAYEQMQSGISWHSFSSFDLHHIGTQFMSAASDLPGVRPMF